MILNNIKKIQQCISDIFVVQYKLNSIIVQMFLTMTDHNVRFKIIRKCFVIVGSDSCRKDWNGCHGVTQHGEGNSVHDAASIRSNMSLNSHLRSHM